jgi:GT2 family glycosyltransferase
MKSSNPVVSIVVLNLNGKDCLGKCLRSLFESKYENKEIIVVDNGSTDGSQDFVKSQFPSVKLIENQKNLGFGPGNNVGIKNATGDFVLFLNNDVLLDPDCIGILTTKMVQEEDIGVIGCKIYVGSLNKVIQHAGGTLDPSGSGILIGYLEKDVGQYDEEKNVDWVHGAAFLVRKSVFKDVGMFDPIYYPIYHDEVDLCYRAKKFGYKIRYEPSAEVYHFEDIGSEKTFKTAFFRIRNTLIFACKYTSAIRLPLLPFLHVKIIINGLKSPKYHNMSKLKAIDLIIAYVKAFAWILESLPIIMEDRCAIKQKEVRA